ncbi:MAG TPA: FAD-binding oxidoreductase [Acidothermaceae bacterium]|jgi:glycine/D-amino acid oxidase-like deaminating enzyme|nr:FAD-binding oxidoreductase [Acidothermaceae bacterium]
MAAVTDYRTRSLWLDDVAAAGDALNQRPSLPGAREPDVAIVGAGYTGLWTAFYLLERDPTLRIVLLEKEIAGFGASGRNGGWCSALFPASMEKIAAASSRDAALALRRAMRNSVDEVGAMAAQHGIDCGYTKGGTLSLIRSRAQITRAREKLEHARSWGEDSNDIRLLDAAEAAARLNATDVLGALFTPHCAAIHPAKLVRGLAAVVEGKGATIYEGTAATAISPHRVDTRHGVVRADVVIRATEGYTPTIRGNRRALAPVYSLMMATEPLPDTFWDDAGLADRETFNDLRHLIIYGQRTADGRLAFGGRGAPYHFGSRVDAAYDREPRVFDALRRIVVELFPALAGVAVTHTWGGPLGVPRDWFASVGLDRATGLGWAGGYVGDGVATSNLAGRTLADLITGHDTELTALPWVDHRSRAWEPEPLRWLGINGSLAVVQSADAAESRTSRPSRRARLVDRLTGG